MIDRIKRQTTNPGSKPILTSLILASLSIQALAATSSPIPLEKTVHPASSFQSSPLRKMHFESAYQPNFVSVRSAEAPMGKFVGELQEKWQFPSDHLPIGMTIDGLHIASWNVLNSVYMGWVEKNSQGLSRSLLVQEHVYLGGSKLTFRDLHVIECVRSMLAHPTHPKSVISLQECGEAFLTELQSQLPEGYGIVLSSNVPIKDQNIVIYDKRAFDYNPSRSGVSKIFSKDKRTVLNVCLTRRDTREAFRVINGHLPGEPGNPAPDEFAAYTGSFATPNETVIAMGDMNFNEVEMKAAFHRNVPKGFPLETISPYCTNIGLDFCSKSIDHFFIVSQKRSAILKNDAEEVMVGLRGTLQLL